MTFSFPEFPEQTAIDAERSWTAVFESWDQRNDDIYYLVTLRQNTREVAKFVAHVWVHYADGSWFEPGFADHLHHALHQVAVTGKTNTSYIGAMSRVENVW